MLVVTAMAEQAAGNKHTHLGIPEGHASVRVFGVHLLAATVIPFPRLLAAGRRLEDGVDVNGLLNCMHPRQAGV